MYRITVDRSLCSSFGSCSELRPDIFQLDDEGLVTARVGLSRDPEVLEVAATCPMGAILVEEVEG
jgi:ferredoxin